ncbi:MAG: hypothetical protein K2P78_04885 [Gemmataceae bacterium]|nr:hypothetical protein [Gemmataceae bacterium]
MARRIGLALAAAALGVTGCATAPPLDNPLQVRTPAADCVENPVLVSPGVPTGTSYKEVFEKCVDVLNDYFVLREANPYSGRIVAFPRIAPGYEQPWKAGNPDPRERLLATLQTIRQTAVIEVRTADRGGGGYLVSVLVEKELEDLPRPALARFGAAVFQETPTVDRQVIEVVGPATSPDRGWYKVGRDFAFEQLLLDRIRRCR